MRVQEVTAMTTSSVRVERRAGQRFPYLLPVSLRQPESGIEGVGFTQDLSSRGVFFVTDAALTEGAPIELTLKMPSEITLGESMPVRCRGRILRVVRPTAGLSPGSSPSQTETKIGVAVRLEGYEYLPSDSSSIIRVSNLHPHPEEDRPLIHSSSQP
jgi:PilZ domain